MNNNDIRYFCVLADTLHYGKAAQILHITQPPLTRAIQRLEDELGVLLFKRNQRNVALTPAGEYMKRKGDALFAELTELVKEVRKIDKGKSGQLHITSVGSIVPKVIEYIGVFINRYPDVNIRLSQYTTTEQLKLIKSGVADIAFIRCPTSSEGLHLQSIYDEIFVLVTPRIFKQQIKKADDLQRLTGMPYISFPREYGKGTFDKIISLCNAGGYSPDIKYEPYQLDTAIRMVEVGLGITIVPKGSLNGVAANVNVYELDFMPQRSVVSCCYNVNQENPILNNFLKEFMGQRTNH